MALQSQPTPEGEARETSRAPSIFTLLGIKRGDLTAAIRPYRARRRAPCPQCGRDSECLVIPDERQPGHVHVYCTRDTSGVEMPSWGFKGTIYYFFIDAHGVVRPTHTGYQRREIPLAEQPTQARILRFVARHFGLSAEHRELLGRRGYDAAECGPDGRYVFASLPDVPGARYHVVYELLSTGVANSEAELLGTLGFRADNRRREDDRPIEFMPAIVGTALIEFRLDELGQITGFQVAPDAPELDAKGKPRKRLSPPRMLIADHYHAARPAEDDGRECWHTEAIHKANLTARARRAVALGALGVGNVSGLLAGARAIDHEARRDHVLALDADHHASKEETQLATRLHDAGYRVWLARWDISLGNGPDDAIIANAEITLHPWNDHRPQPRRDTRITHAHAWQRATETHQERETFLSTIVEDVRDIAEQHLISHSEHTLAVAVPPGAGKTYGFSELGARSTIHPEGRYDLAYIVQRLNMRSEGQLHTYRLIESANRHNCSAHELHRRVAAAGFNTQSIHSQHPIRCAYNAQFLMTGSAVYQLAHVQTSYPNSHRDGKIIDEFVLSDWLPARWFPIGKLVHAAAQWPAGSRADLLLRAIQVMLTDAFQAHTQEGTAYPLDKALFDTLDAKCGGHLTAWLGALEQDERVTNQRPWADIALDDPDALEQADRLPDVVLPHLWHALAGELHLWQRGERWNSRMQIGIYQHEPALCITETRRFGSAQDGNNPPTIILDATADEAIYQHLFGAQVTITRAEVTPPPGMRHIAIRTGKRYGKVSLTSANERDLTRAIAEARYLLSDLDPDGAKRHAGAVGLITFMDVEQELGDALGIDDAHTLHFQAARGSNNLRDCEILLIIGTPMLPPHEILRLARGLYVGEAPIDESYHKESRTWADPRVQHLSDYLIRSELTQCAHRNRPLRFDGRTVVTFCQGEIDYLPMTTEITSLPMLTAEGDERVTKRQEAAEVRLRAAVEGLTQRGEAITVRAVSIAARVRIQAVSAWLRQQKFASDGIAETFPESQKESLCTTGNSGSIPPPLPISPPASPQRAPGRWARVEQLRRLGYSESEAQRQSWREWQAADGYASGA